MNSLTNVAKVFILMLSTIFAICATVLILSQTIQLIKLRRMHPYQNPYDNAFIINTISQFKKFTEQEKDKYRLDYMLAIHNSHISDEDVIMFTSMKLYRQRYITTKTRLAEGIELAIAAAFGFTLLSFVL